MAKRSTTYKPLQMPSLSALPDPAADMLGGFANPASLTRPTRQAEDLLNPQPVQDTPFKMSPQAKEGLDMLSRGISSAEKFADDQRKLEQQRQAALEKEAFTLQEKQRKDAERRVKAIQKANEKAAKSGGTTGAGPGGSFLFEKVASDLAAREDWNAIASTIERRDQAKANFAEAADYLRQQGVSEDVINAEMRAGSRAIEKYITEYRKKMEEDQTGVFDVVLGGAGIVAQSIAKGVATMTGNHEFAAAREDDIKSIRQWMSTEYQLDSANNAYIARRAEARASGLVDEYTGLIGDMFSEDEADIGAAFIDQWAYFAAGGGASKLISTGARALGLGARTVGAQAAANAAGQASKGFASRVASTVANPEFVGASVGSGALVAVDAAGGAYDAVQGVSYEELSRNYRENVGETNWNALVEKFGGDETAIKNYIATSAARKAGALGFGLGLATGGTGVDSMAANLMGRKLAGGQLGRAAVAVGNRASQAALGAVTETAEEGLTQLASNVASAPSTGENVLKGVGTGAALGTITGGGTSAAIQAGSAVLDARADSRAAWKATGVAVDPAGYVSAGELNLSAYRAAVGERMQGIAQDGLSKEWAPEDIAAAQQMVYDDFIDDPAKWAAFTPEQREDFREYLRRDWGINTNEYAPHVTPEAEAAFMSGDINRVLAVGNDELTQAFRVANNVDVGRVPENLRTYYTAVADVIEAMATQPKARDTQQRRVQFKAAFNDIVADNDALAPGMKHSIAAFGSAYLGASPRRMTDEEQARWTDLRESAELARRNQQENQYRGTTEQAQESSTRRDGAEAGGQAAGSDTRGGASAVPAQQAGAVDTEPAVADAEPRGTGAADAQGAGDGGTRQGTAAGGAPDAAAPGVAAGLGAFAGAGETDQTGVEEDTSPPAERGGAVAGAGDTGQALAAGQPVGSPDSAPTPQAGSGGGVGASPAERDTDGGGAQAPAEAADLTPVQDTGALEPLPPLADDSEVTRVLDDIENRTFKALNLRYGDDAPVMAALPTAFFRAMSRHMGITPDEFATRFAPTVSAVGAMADVAGKVRLALLQADSTLEGVQRRWSRAIANYRRSDPDYRPEFATPAVLLEFDSSPRGVSLSTRHLMKILDKHRDVPLDVIKRLPTLLHDPLYIYPHRDGGVNVVVDASTERGEPIIVGVRDGRVVTITPQHDNDVLTGNGRLFRKLADAISGTGKVYVRNKNALTEIRAAQAQSPNNLDGRGKKAKAKILSQEDLVKRYGENYYQGDRDARRRKMARPRGAYTPARNLIELFESADPSTFIHEFGHYALDTMVEVANIMGDETPEQLTADIDTLLAHGGVSSLEAWNGMSFDDRRDAHETIARSFEAYIFEGRAPSPELRGVFARLAELLRTVYRRIRDMRVNLTPDVREVFDRMLAEPTEPVTQQETDNGNENAQGADSDGSQTEAIRGADEEGDFDLGGIRETDDRAGEVPGESGSGIREGSAGAAGQGDAQGSLGREREEAGGGGAEVPGETNPPVEDTSAPEIGTLDAGTVEVAIRNAGLTAEENQSLWDDDSVRNPFDELDESTPAERMLVLARDLIAGEVDPENDAQARAARKMQEYLSIGENIAEAAAEAASARERQRADAEVVRRVNPRRIYDAISDALTTEEFDTVDEFLDENGASGEGVVDFLGDTLVAEQTGDTLSTLQARALRVLKDIFDKIRAAVHSFAMVSLAGAALLGSNLFISPQAQAAADVSTPLAGEVVMTSAAKATLDQVMARGDNEGKPFVIADKRSGMLYTVNAGGQVVNTTPALFGKDKADERGTSGTTPAGRFNLSYSTDARLPTGYRGSVQTFDTGPSGELFAIHRVLDLPGQNRPGRLASATGKDNRITLGCINIPADVYDKHFDGDTGAVLYILPDSAGWGGNLFLDPATEVSPSVDMASREPVKVPAEQIAAVPPAAKISQTPAVAQAPIVVQGQQATGQSALIQPAVIGGVSFGEMDIPTGVYTPAEMQANGVFDTAPVTGAHNGHSLASASVGIVAWLASGGLGYAMYRNRKRKKAAKEKFLRKKADRAAQRHQEDATNPVDAAPDMQADVDALRDSVEVSSRPRHIPRDMQAPPSRTARDAFAHRSEWLKYYEAAAETGKGGVADMDFAATLLNFEGALDAVLHDMTYAQAQRGDFSGSRKWSIDERDPMRSGVLTSFLRAAGGATAVFDNWTKRNGVASLGHEADSSAATVALSGIKTRAAGARSYIHRTFIHPLEEAMMALAGSLRVSVVELENDVGRLATVRHVLNEAADAHFRGMEMQLRNLQAQLDVAGDVEAEAVRQQIESLLAELDLAQAVYNGEQEWDHKSVKMPGGYTKASAEAVIEALQSKYGNDFARISDASRQLVSAIQGVRKAGTAFGVHSNKDLAAFEALGFTEYVPLYRVRPDPSKLDTLDDETQFSQFELLTRTIPQNDAMTMGLSKDLTQFHREGSFEPAADAFTNLRLFASNMAGRAGARQWEAVVQQMYEGTTGRDISASVLTDEKTLGEINASPTAGRLPGLIRVTPSTERFLDGEIRAKITDANGNLIRPIRAKGYNATGDLVDYHYYFTEKAIQNEVYGNMAIAEDMNSRALRNMGSLTRVAARLMTTYKPVWNLVNMARDSIERLSIMFSRPVKDQNGELVPRAKIAAAYGKSLAQLVGNPAAMGEVYRYIATGEASTALQQRLREAERNGAITLMTSLTARSNILNELQRSDIDRLARRVGDLMGTAVNKTGLRGVTTKGTAALDFYVEALTETPQVMVALAAYNAYKSLGVNDAETANRVRDQYDPLRSNSSLVRNLGPMFPFVRSTFSGHYNVVRTLTEYWRPGEWQGQALYLAGGVAAAYILMGMAAGMMGDDEDGLPLMARLPIGSVINGVPVHMGDGIYTVPVGFGVPKLMWGTAANLFKVAHGQQGVDDMALSMAGLILDNTSPISTASGGAMTANPVGGILLTATPTLVQPLVEAALNVKSFGGGRVYTRDTKPNQRDSEVDDFNTPEVYKRWAKALYAASSGFFDVRPESIKHALESYSYGPFKTIPVTVLSDRKEKTLGYQATKGDEAGVLMTMLGGDIGWSPNALKDEPFTWRMREVQTAIHRKYGVPDSHSNADYARYNVKKGKGQAAVLTRIRLQEAGASDEEITFVLNSMQYAKDKKGLQSDFREAALEYYNMRQRGEDDPQLREAVERMGYKLEDLNRAYIEENSHAFLPLSVQ